MADRPPASGEKCCPLADGGMATGNIILWVTGNDVYSRLTLLAGFDRERLLAVAATARAVISRFGAEADEVLVLGPLSRLAGEIPGLTWESTAAYHLQRTLTKQDPDHNCRIVSLGRSLTQKMGRSKRGLIGTEEWFGQDRIYQRKDTARSRKRERSPGG